MNKLCAPVPLIDRSDFNQLLAEHRFGRWSQQASDLHTLGYCTVDLIDPPIEQDCDRVIDVFGQRLAPDLQNWETGKAGSMRVQDGWKDEAAVRRLALHPLVLDLLRHLYGREPFAFQTLNFAVGSEQHFHSDAVHFHGEPQGFMCGVWIPLADVDPDSGPLFYYPGSHRLPYRSAAAIGLSPEKVAAEPHPQRLFEPGWRDDVERLGLTPQLFLPRRGQALIWHANLLHGGSPVANRQARRWSQVVHFYFKGCIYTTPMKSFGPEHGGVSFRQPHDIATGQIIDLSMQRISIDNDCRYASDDSHSLGHGKQRKAQRWLARLQPRIDQAAKKKLKGNIELISPSLITGWLYHPDFDFTEVRLVSGNQLVANAPVDDERLDVNAVLALDGFFGFRITISDWHLEPKPEEHVQLIALTTDGSMRFSLKLSGPKAANTEARLRLALSSSYRGLRGHFDGINLSRYDLSGWCYSPLQPKWFVWLHAEGLKPIKIPCCSQRQGGNQLSLPNNCGFQLPLSSWPEAAGRRVWASFDEDGELRLPPLTILQLPEHSGRSECY